jgi:hypothetical protein
MLRLDHEVGPVGAWPLLIPGVADATQVVLVAEGLHVWLTEGPKG